MKTAPSVFDCVAQLNKRDVLVVLEDRLFKKDALAHIGGLDGLVDKEGRPLSLDLEIVFCILLFEVFIPAVLVLTKLISSNGYRINIKGLRHSRFWRLTIELKIYYRILTSSIFSFCFSKAFWM